MKTLKRNKSAPIKRESAFVAPSAIKNYLEGKGWTIEEQKRGFYIFQNADQSLEIDSLMFPVEGHEAHYPLEVQNLLLKLSEIYNQSKNAILREIYSLNKETLLAGLHIEDAADDSPLVKNLPGFFKGLRNLIAYSAAQLTPDPPRYVDIRNNEYAKAALGGARLGHTRPGSFVFPVSLHHSSAQPGELFGDEGETEQPLARRTLFKLYESVRTTLAAKGAEDAAEQLTRSTRNSNFCRTFYDDLRLPGVRNHITFGFEWSQNSALPPVPDTYIDPLEVAYQDFEWFRAAGRQLEGAETTTCLFLAKVKDLKPDDSRKGPGRAGKVTFKIVSAGENRPNLSSRSLDVELEADQYAVAHKAHLAFPYLVQFEAEAEIFRNSVRRVFNPRKLVIFGSGE